MVSVNDTGEGMDQETVRHIFEPFYTTKAIGRGTGLGLSSAYGVIKQSGGDIWVYSEPGKGTTFKIYLPRASGEVESVGAAASLEAIAGGSGTVLVAEDEPVVRDLIVATLTRLGYDLVTAEDGQEALERFTADPDRIDVLVSDVVMPRLGGIELVEAVRRVRPGLPAILVSGYSENLLPAGSLAEGVTLLQKPFTNRRLAEAIREAIDRGRGDDRPEADVPA
jgi:CheY-like chemotaxis protein